MDAQGSWWPAPIQPHSISSSNPNEASLAARSRRDGDMSTPAAPVVVGSFGVAVAAWAATAVMVGWATVAVALASVPMAETPGQQWFIRDFEPDVRKQRCRRLGRLRAAAHR
jgi:hypothetical protein